MKKLMILIFVLMMPAISHAGNCAEFESYRVFSKFTDKCNAAMQKSGTVKTFRTNKDCISAVKFEDRVMVPIAKLPHSVVNACVMQNYRKNMKARASIERYNQTYFNVREHEKRGG